MSAPRLIRPRPAPRPGIVHFGPGAFFRAHLAPFTEDALAQSGGKWGVIAVSLKSPAARDQLAPQDGAYTSVTLSPDGRDHCVIGVISECLVAPEDPTRVIDALTNPDIRIVSLTITEKGYPRDMLTGGLDRTDPDIRHDLAHPTAPRTAIGFIVAGLARRRAAGHRPYTVMSCDNLPGNGAISRRLVLDFAEDRDPTLATWIADEGAFPSTMVDRITPATTPDDIAALTRAQGYHDPACVVHEPFRQWVIADQFVDGARPAWERVGAEIVSDVAPHEAMKLRCLNGAHSALAYLGYLAGHQTIAATVSDLAFATFCNRLWDEILPNLTPPDNTDMAAYCRTLLVRFQNPNIHHRTWQIAMDGSQKLPQRLLSTLSEALTAGRPMRYLAHAIAGWMVYVSGTDEEGNAIDVRDPMAEAFHSTLAGLEGSKAQVAALMEMKEVFPPELAKNALARAALSEAHAAITQQGARDSLMALS